MINEVITNFLISLSANQVTDMMRYVNSTLLPHQMTNLSAWFSVWNPTQQDIDDIKNNENLCRLFSVIFEKVQNEIFEKKIDKWGCIANNIIMAKHTELSSEKRFIKLFVELDEDEIEYLLRLKLKGKLSDEELYPQGFPAPKNTESERNGCLQVGAAAKGLAIGIADGVALTGLGERFVEFISIRYNAMHEE